MASDIFLKVNGIVGESTDNAHKDEIEVLAYNHGVSMSLEATPSSAGGGTSGRCNHSDFSITKSLDKASPLLAQRCCSGEHIDEIAITLNRASGDTGGKVPYMVYTMKNVVISSVSVGGGDGAGVPTETVAFNYGSIKWEYAKQARKGGGAAGKTAGTWNVEKNNV